MIDTSAVVLRKLGLHGLILLLLVTALGAFLLAVWQGTREFKEGCAKTGGVAAFDGRQYQCLKETSK